MKRSLLLLTAALSACAAWLAPPAVQAQPSQVSYQGQLLNNGNPFDGTANFKFVIVSSGGATLWSNDGTSANGSQPTGSVPLTVTQGLFSVRLGDTPMVPLTTDLLNMAASASLRIWVDTGGGFEQLPDQPISSSPFALHSESAERSIAGFTANGVVHSLQGGFQFPDGTIQTTASTGGGGGNTLDQAYNQGGPGAGRTINVNAGAVNLAGADGLRVNGSIGIGTTSTTPYARLSVQNVGGVDDAKLLAFDEAEGGEFFFESGFAGTGSTGNKLKLNTAWVTGATVWRGDGHIGIGADPSESRVLIFHSGTTNQSPALAAINANTGDAYGLVAATTGTGPAATFQSTSGDDARFLSSGGSTVGRVDNTGKAFFSSMQNNSGTTVLDGSGRWRLTGGFGGGVGGAPIYSENTTSNGVAFWGKTTSSDGTVILEQNGTGSLVRAFKSGSLKFEVQNSGRVVTTALQITGGGDLAEPFTVAGEARPGSVLVIDDARPGELKLSDRAYDTRVAGVISGAGGIQPGITLTPGEHQSGGRQVALTGRVYAWADAANGPIRPGDLLTTSETPGHLMKATDPARASGAILGKAMSALESGRGLVLVLVSLQ
jgi:hypothetical protein